MAFRSFLQQLLNSDDLKQIATEVSADQEVSALCRREFASPSGGQALLFSRVKGTSVKVAANLLGRRQRVWRMYDLDEELLVDKLQSLIRSGRSSAADNLAAACQKATELTEISSRVEYCHRDLALADIPALRSWPGEMYPYLTLALTHTEAPGTNNSNLGLYRGALVGDQHIALNFAPGSGAGRHLQLAESSGESLPVALVLGADPLLWWAAAAPLPDGCNEYSFSETIGNRTIARAPCLTQPLTIPADAEIVIEGEITPGARISEGPFANHTGQYVSRADCPLMTVTAIRHRAQPILPVTVVGPPPSENVHLAYLNQLLLREMLRYDFPVISDLAMPEMTIFHGVAIIAIKSCQAAEVAQLIQGLTTSTWFRKARLLILVDDDINVQDVNQSWWRTINQLSPEGITATDKGLVVDATGIDRRLLVAEDPMLTAHLHRRQYSVSVGKPDWL